MAKIKARVVPKAISADFTIPSRSYFWTPMM